MVERIVYYHGNVSTVAQIPDDVSEGSVLRSTIALGTGGQTIPTEIKIIDVKNKGRYAAMMKV